jgi:hypothetical protein
MSEFCPNTGITPFFHLQVCNSASAKGIDERSVGCDLRCAFRSAQAKPIYWMQSSSSNKTGIFVVQSFQSAGKGLTKLKSLVRPGVRIDSVGNLDDLQGTSDGTWEGGIAEDDYERPGNTDLPSWQFPTPIIISYASQSFLTGS